ncbi:MAG: type I secretion system permease/ATPase, partial [Pseudomonadota bacterium]
MAATGNEQTYTGALRHGLGHSKLLFVWLAVFSFFINVLMLTGPIYMLQIYDRVLSSQSVPTLIALTVLVGVLYAGFWLLEVVRGGLLQRVGARFERHVVQPVFEAAVTFGLRDQGRLADQPLRDARSVRQFITSPALTAIYDAPFSPLFLAAIFLMHAWLGWLALGGAAILICLAIANEVATRRAFRETGEATLQAQAALSAIVRNVEVVEAMGMRRPLQARWQTANAQADGASLRAGDRNGTFSSTIKAFRLFLQSAMLGLGAYLAVGQEITPGVMIAASIILGRALAPIEQGVGQWRGFIGARDAWGRLNALLTETKQPVQRMPLPPITGALEVKNLYVTAPGGRKPLVHNVSFRLAPGETLGIIGPSASGKSTLARALVGVWVPGSGAVRLDGAEIHKCNRDDLGPQIGYLPQEVELFAGTVQENIGRFALDIDNLEVVRAAQEAGCHTLILNLPEGYETNIGPGGSNLSAGQRQRVALARALYGKPRFVVLDEPNANLDAEGDAALADALTSAKKSGATVVIVSHRPNVIRHVDKLLMMQNGAMRAFGPPDEVTKQVLQTPQKQTGGGATGGSGGRAAQRAQMPASDANAAGTAARPGVQPSGRAEADGKSPPAPQQANQRAALRSGQRGPGMEASDNASGEAPGMGAQPAGGPVVSARLDTSTGAKPSRSAPVAAQTEHPQAPGNALPAEPLPMLP